MVHAPIGVVRNSHNRDIGETGENIAAQFLLSRNYTILARNVRYVAGELDLIAQSPTGAIVFVEVKARTSSNYGNAEAVSPSKLRKMRRSAALWLRDKPWTDVRFDVIAITLNRTTTHEIDWYQGVDSGAC
ncbi:MAG: YraN family protein [Corynebacterium sp.]|uniref:YraN family protein n=1 Tax=Corynebacterium sp. TaxID=1720 RepID=UPI0026DBAD5E|nr:YraN family protein [Corynebacterium sp.]MDO5097964.1 YraN family protein [Corynebacterium sp.]